MSNTENIKIIKWLITLPPRKQIVAMLLIVVVVLFTPLSIIFKNNAAAVRKCNVEKLELVQSYTKQIEGIKDKQIRELQEERERAERIDSALKITDRIIKNKTEK